MPLAASAGVRWQPTKLRFVAAKPRRDLARPRGLDEGGWRLRHSRIAQCPEIPGANGQGETVETAKESLRAAVELILEDRRDDMLRGLPSDAIREALRIG
jgi:hypothetical protein